MFSASKTAGASGSSGYNINNSLRFRASASAYLSRTPSVAGNRQTWTWSGWVKRGSLQTSSRQTIFSASDGTLQNYTEISFDTNSIRLLNYTANVKDLDRTSTSVYRDPSAWYHIVLAFDTTQAVATNRQRVYVNGVEVTAWTNTAQMAQNANGWVSSTQPHRIALLNGFTSYFDGYLANVDFIDGQALTPSSFGETSSTTGVWIPKKYTGSYGTNGFYLNFSNGTSTTTLGYDSSGNGNNWTTNNISLTAGSTYDWMIDSPTPYAGSSYGVGNYCVLNPLDVAGSLTISDANSKLTGGSSAWGLSRSGFGMTSGKWYWEVTILSANTAANGIVIGIANTIAQTAGYGTANNWSYNNNTGGTGRKNLNGVSSSYGITYVANDVVGVAFNADAGTLTFYVNNSSQGVAASSGLPNPAFPMTECYGTDSVAVNFGQRPFAYTPPSGYKSLCTQNLPGVTIQNGAAYMAATTYTGNGSTQTISGAAFQPDLVWVKCRSVANNHVLYDSVRGAVSGKALSSCLTAQEGLGTTDADSKYGYVSSLNSNGFSVAGGSLGQQYVNTSAATYIGWQWKAGGTAVTNTAGSITSSVSANPTAGFSVVTYTGTGVNATVGHGLGVALSMIFIKSRTGATADPAWIVGHTGIVMGSGRLVLNATSANSNAGAAVLWNSTAATSSVFSLGNYVAVNESGSTYVAYCFAAIPGYSAFGSYTGNGSTDGPFVYCGFRPRFVLVKRTDTGGYNWVILDTSRNTYNVASTGLYPNLSNAEDSGWSVDINSNGFKMRDASGAWNASGGTYIYAAFCEVPFSLSLAR